MREGRCVMVRNEKKEMTAGEIADKICEIAPEALQETWDNSGFRLDPGSNRSQRC